MEKETVFNIGDEVWFIQANKVRHGVIKKIRYIKFLSPSSYDVEESETYYIETDLYNVYNSYLNISLDNLFRTKEDLLNSL